MKRKLFNIFIITILLLFLAANTSFGGVIKSGYVRAIDEDESADGMPELLDIPKIADDYMVVEKYATNWTEDIAYDIRYDEYDVFPNYVVNLSSTRRKIYEEPDSLTPYYGKLIYGKKLQAVALIEDDAGALWYAVAYEHEDETVIGYIQESKVSLREFQLEEMNKYLQNVSGFENLGHIVYIKNYKYESGYPPRMPNGSYYDDFGYRRGQSAGGYYDSSMDGKFRYIPDGTLCIVEQVIEETTTAQDIIVIDGKGIFTTKDELNEYFEEDTDDDKVLDRKEAIKVYNEETEVTAVKLFVPSFGVSLWVDEKYLNEDEDTPDVLNQAIIVDRLNQNIAVFEYDEEWKVISMSYSSTGKVGEFSLPTPLGYYMAITKKSKFDYVEDGTYTITGFAPYVIRFSGGGYLHGVPMSYDFTEGGEKISPGYYVEYLSSIGTTPKSHMCVRNYTSHAEFMYRWVDIGYCTVIVIE